MSSSNLARRSSRSRSSAEQNTTHHSTQPAHSTAAPLTILTGSHVTHSLHLSIDHALLKLHIGVKHLAEVSHGRDCLDGLFIDVPRLKEKKSEGEGEGEKEGSVMCSESTVAAL